ncbi:MAG: DUF2505 domain-containing protein [Actinomycetota bacterium]|nr:MAG: DUF2505 domain-containing protein [Actinomycetota bacterium]
MSTRFTAVQRFGADARATFAMLRDPAYVTAKGKASGATSTTPEVREEGDGVVVVSRRSMPTTDAPSLVQRFIGPTVDIVETQTWSAAGPDGSRTASVHATFGSAPASMTGTATLADDDDGGCTLTAAAEVTSSIPFAGRKVEELVRDQVLRYLRKEETVARTWLTASPGGPDGDHHS